MRPAAYEPRVGARYHPAIDTMCSLATLSARTAPRILPCHVDRQPVVRRGACGRRVSGGTDSPLQCQRIALAVHAQARPAVHITRRRLIQLGGAACVLLCTPRLVQADEFEYASDFDFVSGGGIKFFDVKVGTGEAPLPGDVVKIVYSARALPTDLEGKPNVFDPYGSGGSSMAKAYKMTLGGSDSDLEVMKGWELSILGDGKDLPAMRAGGHRVARIPAALAYGQRGLLCRQGVRTACEVPPGATVEIDTVLYGLAY